MPIAHATGGLNLLATIEKNAYRRKRKLLCQGFPAEALKNFEPKMLKLLEFSRIEIAKGSRPTEDCWTRPKNMRDWCSWLTFDIIGKFGYSVKLDTMIATDNGFMIDVVLALDARNGIHAQAPNLPTRILDMIWPLMDRRTLLRSLNWRRAASTTVLGGEAITRCLFTNLLEAKDPKTGQGLSFQELMA